MITIIIIIMILSDCSDYHMYCQVTPLRCLIDHYHYNDKSLQQRPLFVFFAIIIIKQYCRLLNCAWPRLNENCSFIVLFASYVGFCQLHCRFGDQDTSGCRMGDHITILTFTKSAQCTYTQPKHKHIKTRIVRQTGRHILY